MKKSTLTRRQGIKTLSAATLGALLARPLSAARLGCGKAPLKLLFDTDIGAGTDIDDALTLIILLNSPEIDLQGVTTVQRDPSRRAEFARGLIASMGRGGEIPVYAGAGVPIREAPDRRADAVKFIVRSIREADGPRHMLVVGAQTNVALALREEPALAERLEGITLMGYKFDTLTAPFNVNNDLDAAQVLLTSGIPLRVLPVEIGVACQMQEGEYNRLLASECPQMKYIREPMQRWVQHVRQRPGNPIPDYLPRPYDSLSAITLTHPELFQWKRGTIGMIDLTPGAGQREGNTRFRESADGLHEIVVGVDREQAMALHEERLLTCPP